ncbi:MAG: pyridoxamine 5'-phosphate oxidase family protein [Steroidobacteraceae bacterium]|nr:pyridoxamine 5'-phosphate oxidase family protein [Nevskiaceae bacterium]MCP5339209.1 pyridoxamine 5'-phosphate oxidase family protein [Nevskiaceae bacterium]MCP5359450.1 pyridoxamine 5'-phosphate oxidase family protein [Nevskiaceae bacterium]MCP5470881.1 pyridoxamine 5'-phosphate oxidase family protein [Nevskiaceae bacterium]
MDPKLQAAIEALHDPAAWVHLATIGRDGSPHVTPMMMGRTDEHLLFSLTGKQKVRNLERDPRACVAISKPVTMAHVIVWGRIEIRVDDAAQQIWEAMITRAFGPDGLGKRARTLSRDGTMLGVLTPERYRIYGLQPPA